MGGGEGGRSGKSCRCYSAITNMKSSNPICTFKDDLGLRNAYRKAAFQKEKNMYHFSFFNFLTASRNPERCGSQIMGL